jgi:hypothetical protein
VGSSVIRSNAETYNAFMGRQLNGCGKYVGGVLAVRTYVAVRFEIEKTFRARA